MHIELQTGTLGIASDAHADLRRLTGFGSRANKKRGFVFVSKVLGKHYPARPAAMRAVHAELARRARARLDPARPTLVIGFAETATGLGHGVYAHLGLARGVYIHTTRYYLSRPLWLRFEEEHSHATRQLLYAPADPALRALCEAAETVVLVDDEFSTGKTLCNLIEELRPRLPSARRFLGVSILDWMAQPPPGVEWVSLYRGSFRFAGKSQAEIAAGRAQGAENLLLDREIPHNFGRLGVRELAPAWPAHFDPRAFRGQRVLALGSGEFMYPALLLAEHLEAHGAECYVQSTTRSPLNVDGDIRDKLCFADNYFENIDNYLYNLRAYDSIAVCYETARLPDNHRLPELLGAYAREVFTVFPTP